MIDHPAPDHRAPSGIWGRFLEEPNVCEREAFRFSCSARFMSGLLHRTREAAEKAHNFRNIVTL